RPRRPRRQRERPDVRPRRARAAAQGRRPRAQPGERGARLHRRVGQPQRRGPPPWPAPQHHALQAGPGLPRARAGGAVGRDAVHGVARPPHRQPGAGQRQPGRRAGPAPVRAGPARAGYQRNPAAVVATTRPPTTGRKSLRARSTTGTPVIPATAISVDQITSVPPPTQVEAFWATAASVAASIPDPPLIPAASVPVNGRAGQPLPSSPSTMPIRS